MSANRPTPMVSNCLESSSNGNFASDGAHSRSTKTTRTKKVDGAKSTSSFKRMSSSSSKISLPLKASSILMKNGNFGTNNNKPSKQRMGNDIQESGNSNTGGNHYTNSSIFDGRSRWV